MASVRHLGLFPFCVGKYPPRPDYTEELPNQVGDLTEYPFQLPVRLCTRMWWTVKHWRVSFDYYQFRDLSEEYNPGDYTLIDQSITATTSTGLLSTDFDYVRRIQNQNQDASERELICATLGGDWEASSRRSIWNINLRREFLVDEQSGTSNVTAQLDFYTNWDLQDFGFAPPFCFDADETNRTTLWTALSFEFGGWRSWRNAEGETGSGTFSLLQASKQFAISHAQLPANTTESITNLLIEPSEFWEYDPGDGLGPIYDKHTGRKLRAFPN